MLLTIPQNTNAISAEWIDGVLRSAGAISSQRVVGVEVRPIGDSIGYLSTMAVVTLTYEPPQIADNDSAPSSLVVKLEPAAGAFREAERKYRAFEREALFYRHVASQVDVRVPRVYRAEAGPEGSVLVMEDLSRLACGDQVRGMRHAEVIATVRQIGRVHAAYWNNDRLASLDWLPDHDPFWSDGYAEHWPGFAREYEVRLGAEGVALGEALLRNLAWLSGRLAERPSSFVHADLRADNLLFGAPHTVDAVVILDWQLATRSLAAIDPTRLLGGSEPGVAAQRSPPRSFHRLARDAARARRPRLRVRRRARRFPPGSALQFAGAGAGLWILRRNHVSPHCPPARRHRRPDVRLGRRTRRQLALPEVRKGIGG